MNDNRLTVANWQVIGLLVLIFMSVMGFNFQIDSGQASELVRLEKAKMNIEDFRYNQDRILEKLDKIEERLNNVKGCKK